MKHYTTRVPLHPAPVVIVERVSKHYSGARLLGLLSGRKHRDDALHNVSLEVGPGEIVGLLGPNGAGKTTLLKIIAGSLYPSSGSVLVKGRIGLVTSDERSFYWRLTGRQNLEFFAALYKLHSSAIGRRVSEMLDLVGLQEAADRRFDTYSSGMKQRMAIARGLLADPAVILYDEPTRALDPASARDIRQWVKDCGSSRPAGHLIATNQLAEAEQLCDRVVILNRGHVIASGTIADIRSRFYQCAVHRIVCRGLRDARHIEPPDDCGLLKLTIESAGASMVLRIDAEKHSSALTRILERVLCLGGTVESCHSEELPFDEVFCTLVLDRERRMAAGAAI